MIRTVEAVINDQGAVFLQEAISLPTTYRALVTILEEELPSGEPALLSEVVLAEDWNRPEEDEAWLHLQSVAFHDMS